MTPQITRLNESALYALGMDRVTVQALRNIVRITGEDNTSGPTVPAISEQAAATARLVGALRDQVDILTSIIEIIQLAPEPVTPDLSRIDDLALMPPISLLQQVEHLTTEVRQTAEAVANLREFMQTEVRQIADQQAVTACQIQDIQLGKPL